MHGKVDCNGGLGRLDVGYFAISGLNSILASASANMLLCGVEGVGYIDVVLCPQQDPGATKRATASEFVMSGHLPPCWTCTRVQL